MHHLGGLEGGSDVDSALPRPGVSKIYRMGEVEVPALVDVDLDVADGESLVILGPSGSGKSTLLHMLGGMDRPSEGTIRFRDEESDRASTRAA